MSQEQQLSKKEKRAQRDAERHKKGKKRKLAETADEVAAPPAEKLKQDELAKGEDFVSPPAVSEERPPTQKAKSRPEVKKRKREAEGAEPQDERSGARSAPVLKPQKKRKKPQDSSEKDETKAEDVPKADTVAAGATSRHRFILFVGNLPYSATDASLRAHFKSLLPFHLRHRTDPKSKKSKGFAFLEFEGYDKMKTCLKLYHHSIFDPESEENGGKGKGNGKGGRRINVELTAGGGGKAEGRKEKIKVKNERLEGQRQRRAEAERKEGLRKEGAEPAAQADDTAGGEDTGGMHPSRLARLLK